ncbi:DUF1904 family protein [Paenibacillus methanolicus]|uniref:Uncharacterized protein DUF1904 n=1 Tax=Paenibacillus methanolicus TaxID=582686 RepID=A0A5S5BQG0_9BACL|nr:DUF1904 family protein [Paenibacillus methanolicus]TYP68370.1 uncharacterized protein DUF1904 [Paenibacillus methanolicus]
MPQLTFRGVARDALAAAVGPLVAELAEICECGTDNFTVDLLETAPIIGGEGGASYPFAEAAWFERGDYVRNRFAEAVARHMRSAGVADLELAFKVYREEMYYINGRPCG